MAKANTLGLDALRFPKRAQKGEPDLWIGNANLSLTGRWIFPALFWKRLIGRKGDKPRQPDGERTVVVLREEDFWELLSRAAMAENDPFPHVLVQAKWTANLNTTKTLGELVDWMKSHGTSS